MPDDNKIDVYSSPDALEITLKWFSPKSIFLAFFLLFWFGFIGFWYFMAFSSGGPLVMFLIPLIHLVVGLVLLYTVLCSFLNKSFVDIRHEMLSVTHKPIPWWKGGLEIPMSELKQLYVEQIVKNGKNGVSYSYKLRAKLIDGNDKVILGIPHMTSLQLKKIEEHIENYLGIEDEPVKGEYQPASRTKGKDSARKQRRSFSDSNFSSLYFLSKGDEITLSSEDLELVNIEQYDWSDGNTDKYFQFVNYQKQERLIYIEQC